MHTEIPMIYQPFGSPKGHPLRPARVAATAPPAAANRAPPRRCWLSPAATPYVPWHGRWSSCRVEIFGGNLGKKLRNTWENMEKTRRKPRKVVGIFQISKNCEYL